MGDSGGSRYSWKTMNIIERNLSATLITDFLSSLVQGAELLYRGANYDHIPNKRVYERTGMAGLAVRLVYQPADALAYPVVESRRRCLPTSSVKSIQYCFCTLSHRAKHFLARSLDILHSQSFH